MSVIRCSLGQQSSVLTLRDILHPSITGYLSKEFPSIPADEVQRFVAAVRAAGREVGARFLGHFPPGSLEAGFNFHSVALEILSDRQQHCFYLHAVLRYVGAGTAPRARDAEFLDAPYLDPHLPAHYKVLPAAFLTQAFHAEPWMRDVVGPNVWRELLHWKQPRVGDLVFNDYD